MSRDANNVRPPKPPHTYQEYTVVTGDTLAELIKNVNKRASGGSWHVNGNVFSHCDDFNLLCQPMIRKMRSE